MENKITRISHLEGQYFINGEVVKDELVYPIRIRLALSDFRDDIEKEKLKIKSRTYSL